MKKMKGYGKKSGTKTGGADVMMPGKSVKAPTGYKGGNKKR